MPDWSGEIRRRLSAVRLPPEREAGIVDEVAQHLEDRYQTLLASGQPPAEAERRAWRELEGDDDLGRLLSAIEPRSTAEPRRPRSRPPRPSAPRSLARHSVCRAEPAQALDAVGHHHRHARDQSGPDRGGDRHGGRALLQAAAGRRRSGPLAPLRIRDADARRTRSAPDVVRQRRGTRGRRDNCRRDRGAGLDLGVAWRWTVSRLVSPSARRSPPTTSTCSACP